MLVFRGVDDNSYFFCQEILIRAIDETHNFLYSVLKVFFYDIFYELVRYMVMLKKSREPQQQQSIYT